MQKILFISLFAAFTASAQSLPASICGNNQQERGEVCDDGNTTGGDGCSSDCTSLEVCGDKHLDGREQCDDGNSLDGDGCSSHCATEIPFRLPEKARKRALVGTLVSYPLLLLASPQLPDDNGAGVASFLGLTSGLAPSLGHFYTKAYGRGFATALPRYILNSGAAITIGFFSALNRTAPLDQQNQANAVVLTSLFLLPSIALSVWDIKDAPLSIARMKARNKYN